MDTALMKLALDQFEGHLAEVGERWGWPTPCSEWDVRALCNHLLGEVLWVPSLMEGKTIDEVGDRFDGNVVGDEPVANWRAAAADALAAASEADADTRTVHLSFGDFPGSYYLHQVTSDVIIHTWDLAKALGADTTLDPSTLAFADDELTPQVDAWRNAGVFGPPVAPAGDDRQNRLMCATGRDPDWSAG